MATYESLSKTSLNSREVIKNSYSSYFSNNVELKVEFQVFSYNKKIYLSKLYSISMGREIKDYVGNEIWFYNQLGGIKHDALPKRLKSELSTNTYEILFEYSRKSLFNCFEPLRKENRQIKREGCYKFLLKLRVLIEGLVHIHKFAPHGEICPSKILIRKNQILQFAPFVPKNIEHLVSKIFNKTDSVVVPKLYKAPELQKNSLNDPEALKKADIFSLGLCFMHILCPDLSIYQIWQLVNLENFEGLATAIKFREMAWLLFNMLKKSPEERLPLDQCLLLIEQTYLKIFPSSLNYENFKSEELIAKKIPKLLTVWKILFNEAPYVVKNFYMATELIIKKEMEKHDKAKRLVEFYPDFQKFIPISNFYCFTEGNFIISYQFAGLNLSNFLESHYSQEYVYRICYSLINLVYLLYQINHVHTELTLESLHYNHLTNIVNCLKTGKIKFIEDITSKSFMKIKSLRPYHSPFIQEKIRASKSDFTLDSILSSLSYSLGILILKIMYFQIKDQIASSPDPENSKTLQSYTNSIQEPLRYLTYNLLSPQEENRFKISSFSSIIQSFPIN